MALQLPALLVSLAAHRKQTAWCINDSMTNAGPQMTVVRHTQSSIPSQLEGGRREQVDLCFVVNAQIFRLGVLVLCLVSVPACESSTYNEFADDPAAIRYGS
ncbi:hypothetical protein FA15DRAFT_311613 [Coprinopsis marcescibilis]|uniref:Uncharacterized protein n=1 Tax=Coprinopsis marcescibilis TaxID=230819 RepID=A0A5C3L0V2_COPMA|nr:hypothetical protein FA15DRAFT_311613 [Coprinopsis marcescibilis]